LKIIDAKRLLLIIIFLLAAGVRGEELRTWTDAQKRTITASFIKADQAGVITLKQEDGKEVAVPALALSLADRTWLRLKGVNTRGNEIMEYLKLNYDACNKLNELHTAIGKTDDSAKKDAMRREIDGITKERDGYKGQAFELFKKYLPVDEEPFSKYGQEFSLGGALTWTLKSEDNKQLGYVSLVYSDSNKEFKYSAANMERLGIPHRGSWFFFTDNIMLQVTLGVHDTLKKDGAQDAFIEKADIKGLYALGGWK